MLPVWLLQQCLAASTVEEALAALELLRGCLRTRMSEKAQLSSEQAARLAAVQTRVCSVCGVPRKADTCSKCPTCCAKDRSQWGSCKCQSHKKQ